MAGQSGVQKEFLEKFSVRVPPLDEQQHIARTLDRKEEELKQLQGALKAQLAATDALPAALLRRAFNGGL
jgi:type I restriction enzyme, S subunit